MELSAVQTEGRLTVSLRGELDQHEARPLMRDLEALLVEELPRELVLDLSGLSFMDSSGIAVILKTYKLMTELGGRLWIENVPQQPMKVIDAAGIDRLVGISELSLKE